MSRHLVVKALHRDESFLSRGAEKLTKRLIENNEEVIVRDLYELNFNPVLTVSDFRSMEEGNIPVDIEREQNFINQSDYLWFVFPIWWTSMPAILKGYIDRVLLKGFAYRMENDIPLGLLHNKKVIILNSMGMSKEDYESEGFFKALELTIDKGIFEFSGMNVIIHKYYTSIMSANEETRNKHFFEIQSLADFIVSRHKEKNKKKSVA